MSLGGDSPFKICNPGSITQYYRSGTRYDKGYPEMRRFFAEHYQAPENGKGQNGYIRIRFVVNCEGETGRFDVLTCDFNYQPKVFAPEIQTQILELTKLLQGWRHQDFQGPIPDSFVILTFKMKAGKIDDIF